MVANHFSQKCNKFPKKNCGTAEVQQPSCALEIKTYRFSL